MRGPARADDAGADDGDAGGERGIGVWVIGNQRLGNGYWIF